MVAGLTVECVEVKLVSWSRVKACVLWVSFKNGRLQDRSLSSL